MENENEGGFGKQMSIEEAHEDYVREMESRKENSVYVSLKASEQDDFNLTGVIFRRHKAGEDKEGKKWESDVYDYELDEKTPEGISRIISFSIKNKINDDLMRRLKSGERTFTITRTGEGPQTRYTIVEKRQKKGKL